MVDAAVFVPEVWAADGWECLYGHVDHRPDGERPWSCQPFTGAQHRKWMAEDPLMPGETYFARLASGRFPVVA